MLKILQEGDRFDRGFDSCFVADKGLVALVANDSFGVSFYDRIVFNVLEFYGIPKRHRRRAHFSSNHREYGKMIQPIRKEFIIFPISNGGAKHVLCKHQHIQKYQVAGLKLPLLRIIDTHKKLSNGNQEITATVNQTFSAIQFKKITSSIKKKLK